jgi:hypothetical protein
MAGKNPRIQFRFRYHPRVAHRLLISLALLFLALVFSLAVSQTPVSGQINSSAAQAVGGTYGMRQYYLTKNLFSGNQTRNACASGYHFASLWEIADPSSMLYNTSLGLSSPDSGSGPPTAINFLSSTLKVSGWVRTGYAASSHFETSGQDNCQSWVSNIMGDWGSTAEIPDNWLAGAQDIGVWDLGVRTCNTPWYVWCVADDSVFRIHLPLVAR